MRRYYILSANEHGSSRFASKKEYDSRENAIKDMWLLAKNKQFDMVYDEWLNDDCLVDNNQDFNKLTIEQALSQVPYIEFEFCKEEGTAKITDVSRDEFITYQVETFGR